jgi:glycine/serine hydroxymethyltransferase
MRLVASLVADVLDHLSAEDSVRERVIAGVRDQVKALTERFPLYRWKLGPAGV